MPTRFLINQCQIITFLIFKSDVIENSRIELKEIVLPVPSNQIKITLLFNPSTWYNCDFFLFHIEIEGKGGWIIGGGEGKGYVGPPPSQIIGGLRPPLPAPPPSSYAYDIHFYPSAAVENITNYITLRPKTFEISHACMSCAMIATS